MASSIQTHGRVYGFFIPKGFQIRCPAQEGSVEEIVVGDEQAVRVIIGQRRGVE